MLQCRQNTGFLDGYWSNAAAGHVEPGELAIEAAIRETREELGLTLTSLQLRPLATMHRVQDQAEYTAGRVDFFFECTQWQGTAQIMEPHKASSLDWFQLSALPAKVVPHERYILERIGRELPRIISGS